MTRTSSLAAGQTNGAWDPDLWALGLMSGTSLDGIDAALLKSDGATWVETGAFAAIAYDEAFRARLRAVLGKVGGGRGEAEAAGLASLERELTERHAEAVTRLLESAGVAAGEVGVVGFHGQTIAHDPRAGLTRQIGDGALLAALTGLPVVADFRSRDVAAGGEGAPFAPLYHGVRAAPLERPLAVLNLGGVGNVTWIGAGPDELLAFDTGPGNALIDDWVLRTTGQAMDAGGALALAGEVRAAALEALMAHPYFGRPPPKSLDRDDFDPSPVAGLSPQDGAATLTAFSAATVAAASAHFPSPPKRWLVTGGGRLNPALMAALAARLPAPVAAVEAVGWDGDALEAQAFAYLAIRSLQGLPLSLPGTTGVARPTTGGVLHRPPG